MMLNSSNTLRNISQHCIRKYLLMRQEKIIKIQFFFRRKRFLNILPLFEISTIGLLKIPIPLLKIFRNKFFLNISNARLNPINLILNYFLNISKIQKKVYNLRTLNLMLSNRKNLSRNLRFSSRQCKSGHLFNSSRNNNIIKNRFRMMMMMKVRIQNKYISRILNRKMLRNAEMNH